MSKIFFILLAVAAGVAVPFQAGINATLEEHVGHPARAAWISFTVGCAAIWIYALVTGQIYLPDRELFRQAPWWAWIGGLLGSFLVVSSLILAQRLSAALLFALMVAGQIGCGLILDHFGMLTYDEQSLSAGRLMGAALVVGGVILIQRS